MERKKGKGKGKRKEQGKGKKQEGKGRGKRQRTREGKGPGKGKGKTFIPERKGGSQGQLAHKATCLGTFSVMQDEKPRQARAGITAHTELLAGTDKAPGDVTSVPTARCLMRAPH